MCDQELKRGNLALTQNYERQLPIRVIRGHMGISSSGPKFLGYSYDGLYMITSYEFSDGISGFKMYKFNMERLENQPAIPRCIPGCTVHDWNTAREPLVAQPRQVMDPINNVKPECMQVVDPLLVDVKPKVEPLAMDIKPILTGELHYMGPRHVP